MGFPLEGCKRAVYFTDNQGLEAATNWVMQHIADNDFADPFVPPGTDAQQGK
jgi:ubiquitin carboxyl-terminal hydrolase 5/13